MSRHEIVGTIKDWTFYEVTNHGFTGERADRPLYGFTVGTVVTPKGTPKLDEWYNSLDHAMAAAIAEKYTGPRGAGGTGVGTAADWFMRMIGADQLRPAEAKGSQALATVLAKDRGVADPWTIRRIEDKLGEQGIVLAYVPG